ncbi:MAG: molybdenum cofactor guanylyltransferase, partial [Lysinibacillus sp.]|nr:molybdenum cofactor guanylyltransferase [Lysinibacillus sp.]
NGMVTAVKLGDRKHPLVSVWPYDIKEQLKLALEQERLRVMDFLSTVRTQWIDAEELTEDPATYLQNINEPKRM